ncbi:unnamed protein product, partial [Pylaiella littoralis]
VVVEELCCCGEWKRSRCWGAGPRCAKCNEFWRVTVNPKIKNFLSPAHKHTKDKDLSTGQKLDKLSRTAADLKAANEAN